MSAQTTTVVTPSLPGLLLQRTPAEPERRQRPTFDRRCLPADQEQVIYALGKAEAWVQEAIKGLEQVLRHPEAHLPNIDRALTTHFHIDWVKPEERFLMIQKILKGFRQIDAGFANPPFQCEDSCEALDEVDPDSHKVRRTSAYVPRFFRLQGDIHLCPAWFEHFELYKATRITQIIHEMAHKFASKDDNAYERRRVGDIAPYVELPPGKAVENADSFAAFARDLRVLLQDAPVMPKTGVELAAHGSDPHPGSAPIREADSRKSIVAKSPRPNVCLRTTRCSPPGIGEKRDCSKKVIGDNAREPKRVPREECKEHLQP